MRAEQVLHHDIANLPNISFDIVGSSKSWLWLEHTTMAFLQHYACMAIGKAYLLKLTNVNTRIPSFMLNVLAN